MTRATDRRRRGAAVAMSVVLAVGGLVLGPPPPRARPARRWRPTRRTPPWTRSPGSTRSCAPWPARAWASPRSTTRTPRASPWPQEDADGDYPQDGRGYPTDEATIVGWSRDCEIDPVVEYRYRTHRRVDQAPGRPHRAPPRRHRRGHHHRRHHRPLRDPLGAGHHQPLHLLGRHARPGHRDRPDRPRRRPVERAAGVPLRRRGGHRPHPGPAPPGRRALPRGPLARVRHPLLQRHPGQHPLQPHRRRPDRGDGEGPLRRHPRRARSTPSASAAPAGPSSSTSTPRTTPA